MKKKLIVCFVMLGFLMISLKINISSQPFIGVEHTLSIFKTASKRFAASTNKLNAAISAMSNNKTSVNKAKVALKECRARYKEIEFFMEYFFASESRIYNAAPKVEVEESELEYVEPAGLQHLEALLYEKNPFSNKSDIIDQAKILAESANDIQSLLYRLEINDKQILESLRIEMIRIMTLSISGYDAPELESGISEAAVETETIGVILQPYLQLIGSEGYPLADLLKKSAAYLHSNSDFNTFNRMAYLTQYALPIQKHLGKLIRQLHLEQNTSKYLNYDAENLYSVNAISNFQQASDANPALVALGKQLFFDKALSGNQKVSCASCHKADHYFTDGLKRSPALFKDSILRRNTPTLLYAAKQHSQFWDGRVTDLAQQVSDVLFQPLEMGAKQSSLEYELLQERYHKLTALTYPGKRLSVKEISAALAAFIATLEPRNSPFDKYIEGDQHAMDDAQLKGFNLFMGKAKCGTCHFPPYFNALLPPFFDVSEVEILGTTETSDFKKPIMDKDRGRSEIYHTPYYIAAFKTPTVRNAAKTAPYMHNGAFTTLEQVMDFYNKGGGNGIGLSVQNQSLSASPLKLTKTEIKQVIQFINALTDDIKN